MLFLISLVVVSALVMLLQSPIKRFPVAFYVLGLVLAGIYVFASLFGAPVPLWRYFLVFIQRCSIALALFTLVMFASVFPESSRIHTRLISLRRELSILGCIFAGGHVVAYATIFLPRVLDGFIGTGINLIVSLAVSLILAVFLAVLTVTSFVVVRKAMSPEGWKRIQLLAYPFFGLIYVHLAVVLMPSVIMGSTSSIINLIVYSVLFVAYFGLRIRRAVNEKKAPHPIEETS